MPGQLKQPFPSLPVATTLPIPTPPDLFAIWQVAIRQFHSAALADGLVSVKLKQKEALALSRFLVALGNLKEDGKPHDFRRHASNIMIFCISDWPSFIAAEGFASSIKYPNVDLFEGFCTRALYYWIERGQPRHELVTEAG